LRRSLVASLAFRASVAAQSPTPDSVRVARLAALGRLWGAVKYFHPAFLSRAVNWDSALVAAIPRVSAAQSTGEYSAAVSAMLDILGDPATRVATATRQTVRPKAGSVPRRDDADKAFKGHDA
jgi:hypothetical protein